VQKQIARGEIDQQTRVLVGERMCPGGAAGDRDEAAQPGRQ
jgi:hypothetical protein